MSTRQVPSSLGSNSNAATEIVIAPGAVFLSHQFISSLVTSTSLTVPTIALAALIQAEGGSVRFRVDGTAPTGSIGMLIQQGNMVEINAGELASALFIQASGSVAGINVTYTL